MKIAFVGTGISSLVAAHRLHREREIVVYEAAPRLGGHTNTVRVDDPEGALWISTPGSSSSTTPPFEALLEELGVASQPSHMGFSVADGRGHFEYSGTPSASSPAPPTWSAPAPSGCCATGAASTATREG